MNHSRLVKAKTNERCFVLMLTRVVTFIFIHRLTFDIYWQLSVGHKKVRTHKLRCSDCASMSCAFRAFYIFVVVLVGISVVAVYFPGIVSVLFQPILHSVSPPIHLSIQPAVRRSPIHTSIHRHVIYGHLCLTAEEGFNF